MEKGFGILLGRGFQMTFENGFTLSVQFGTGQYCSARDYGAKWGSEKEVDMWKSPDAEVAILVPNGGYYPLDEFGLNHVDGLNGSGVVAGWQSVEDVLELMNKVKDLAPVEA